MQAKPAVAAAAAPSIHSRLGFPQLSIWTGYISYKQAAEAAAVILQASIFCLDLAPEIAIYSYSHAATTYHSCHHAVWLRCSS